MSNTQARGEPLSPTRRWGKSAAGFPSPVRFFALSLLLTAFMTPRPATAWQSGEKQAKPAAQRSTDAEAKDHAAEGPRPDRPPEKPEKPEKWSPREFERQIIEALEEKGEGAKLSPPQVIALLQKKYEIERNTREWEMLDFMGHRAWQRLVRRVAKKYPQAMRAAASGESAVAREYRQILGELGGQENLALLIKQCDARPSWSSVTALGNTHNRQAWPALRRVMNRRLVTYDHLILANLALDYLTRAGDKETLPTMRKWLDSDDARKRSMALRAAAQLGTKELAADLRKADPKVLGNDRERLYLALVSCGDDKYLDEVHAQARDETAFLRESQERPPDPAIFHRVWNYPQNQALDAIAKRGSPRSLPLLDELAGKTADVRIRKRAATIARAIRQATEQPTSPQTSH